jgi:hypothetical protein
MKEIYVQIAERVVGKGDTWRLLNDGKIYSSLTNTLEAHFQIDQKPVDFKLAPLEGKLYVIEMENVKEEPPKKFNIYGNY